MQYAAYVTTEALTFVGEDFVRQWEECARERQAYAYIIPEPDEAQWPFLQVWFSDTLFSRSELRRLCQWDQAPLLEREHAGEPRMGFQWALDNVRLESQSLEGDLILRALQCTSLSHKEPL